MFRTLAVVYRGGVYIGGCSLYTDRGVERWRIYRGMFVVHLTGVYRGGVYIGGCSLYTNRGVERCRMGLFV